MDWFTHYNWWAFGILLAILIIAIWYCLNRAINRDIIEESDGKDRLDYLDRLAGDDSNN